jgi:hypothetical protein
LAGLPCRIGFNRFRICVKSGLQNKVTFILQHDTKNNTS